MPRRTTIVSFALLTACTSEPPDANQLPCEVEAIVEAKCAHCHSEPPVHGAPMPLRTVDDFRPVAARVMQRVSGEAAPMPPPPEAPLSDTEIATLQAWIDGGLRAGDAACGPAGAGGAPALSCQPDIVIEKSAPYTLGLGVEDETKCFGIELHNDGPKRHITAIGPAVDNATIVHHFLVFRAPSPAPTTPFDCALFPPEWDLLYAWAPGAPPQELPEEAGFPIEEGEDMHLVLQMHYNNYAGTSDRVDDTKVELCTTTDLRPSDAGVMSFGGIDFLLPPNRETTLTCSFDVPAQAAPVMPVHIFQSWPHMHQLGRAMATTVRKANGTEQTLVDTNFSFTSQVLYPTNMDIDVGDSITTICRWENSTPYEVSYGEATNDEMCFNIVGYYPAITAPSFNGGIPAAAADCH